MELAEKFGLPVLTFIDTPGAYPGIDAEARGQSEAIARNLYVMADLQTPIVVTVVGEGGSGGALAIGVGDHVMMLQYSTYSVISRKAAPRSSTKAPKRPPMPPRRWASPPSGSGSWDWSTRSSPSPVVVRIATSMPWQRRSRDA